MQRQAEKAATQLSPQQCGPVCRQLPGFSAKIGMKRLLLDNLKNIPGWRTAEKLVVFAVDDYGNVRLDSPRARDQLSEAGLDMSSRFDQYDALETRQDLEALFEVLSSVSDSQGRNAVFTPYALCANPDFDAMSNASAGLLLRGLASDF